MNLEKTIEKLTPMFQSIAEKIGEGANFGWEVVLKQQMAIGFQLILINIVGIIMSIIFFKLILKYGIKAYKHYKEDGDEGLQFSCLVGSAILGIPLFIFTCNCIIHLSNGIMHLINPAYYALEFFINLAK